jgi:NAD/NADP transhydrogenase alpha subunit
MPFVIAVPKERATGEHRVATVPEVVQKLARSGHVIRIEKGAGEDAYYPDPLYVAAGGEVVARRNDLFRGAQVILRVQPPTVSEVNEMDEGTIVIGFMNAARNLEAVARMAGP